MSPTELELLQHNRRLRDLLWLQSGILLLIALAGTCVAVSAGAAAEASLSIDLERRVIEVHLSPAPPGGPSDARLFRRMFRP